MDLIRVLLTRPTGQAEELGAALTAQGIEWLGEPLLRIVPVPWDPGVLAGSAAVLVTSANASRELLRVPVSVAIVRSLPSDRPRRCRSRLLDSRMCRLPVEAL